MAKKVAVLAVNPVNGCGLFQYLETFFENGISYKVFAVSNTKEIRTNSGIALIADDVIANLKGHEDEFDAMVFSCGDAMEIFLGIYYSLSRIKARKRDQKTSSGASRLAR